MDTTAFIERFETATAALSESRNTMVAELQALETVADGVELPATQLEDAATRIEDQFGALEVAQRAALENARTRLDQLHQQLDAAAAEALTAAQAVAGTLSESAIGGAAALERNRETFESGVHGYADTAQEEETRIAAAAGEVAAALGVLRTTLDEHRGTLDSAQTPQLIAAIEGFADAVGGAATQAIDAVYETGLNTCSEAFSESLAQVGQLFETTIGDLDRCAGEIEQHVAQSLRNNLERGANQLIEGATRRMAEEVIEGVVVSQTGVAVTTALAPYLPALIAIKRATDVIKHGLELLKKVTSFGLG